MATRKIPPHVMDAILRRDSAQLSSYGKHGVEKQRVMRAAEKAQAEQRVIRRQKEFDVNVKEHFKDPNVQHVHSWDKDAMLDKLGEAVEGANEMETYFEQRTNKHINLVRKYCKKLADYDNEKFGDLIERGKMHDDSKLKEPERTPYVSITWRHKSDNYKSYKKPGTLIKDDENKATLHHITNNSHHPEYWSYYLEDVTINKNDRDKPPDKIVGAIRMPDIAIAEMVADWCAMGEELGNNAKDWADKNVNIRWKFNDKQKKLIYELIDVCNKTDTVKEAKEYAPGIPNKEDYGNPTIGLNANDLAEFILQRHHTIRNPKRVHFDLRIGVPGKTKGTYSWAVPKAQLPEVGEKRLVVQTPVHGHHYSNFTGTIGKGYGAGQVTMAQRGKALITSVSPNTINFTIADSRVPIRYTLVKLDTTRSTKDWLLIRRALPSALPGVGDKPVVKSIQAKDLDEAMGHAEDIQAKIDGAQQLISFGPKGIEAQSVNKSVKGEPIIHTERLGLAGIDVPKELQGTVVRSEAFGTQGGKAIPFQQLGGLMNTSILGSLTNQRTQKIKMLNALFDVVESQGKPAPKNYMERKKILEAISKTMGDKFIMPPSAQGLEAGRELVNRIETGKEPLTQEGVILRMPGDKTLKYKLRPETKVYFSGIFPGAGKRSNIGGVTYSHEPGGKPIGHIGTGFTDEELQDILNKQDEYKDRPMRIGHQGQFALTRLFRAPSFLGWEEPVKVANTKEAGVKEYQGPLLAALALLGLVGAKPLSRTLEPVVKPLVEKSIPAPRWTPGMLNELPAATSPITRINAKMNPVDMQKITDIILSTEFKNIPREGGLLKTPIKYINTDTIHGVPVKRFPGSVFAGVNSNADLRKAISRQMQSYLDKGMSLEEAFKVFDQTNPQLKIRKARELNLIAPKENKPLLKKKSDITKVIESPVPIALVDSEGKVKTKLKVELADNPSKRTKGLSKRNKIPKDTGMLFDKSGSFWMKDCLVPLDILFLNKTGTVLDTQTMLLSDQYLPSYTSRVKGDVMALEVNAGWVKENNIQVGDRVVVSN